MGIKTATEVVQKTPAEVRWINVQFGGDMAAGETVTAIQTVTIAPAGVVKDNEAFSGTQAQLKLSAGTQDVDYTVTTKVLTSTGQVLTCEGRLLVRA